MNGPAERIPSDAVDAQRALNLVSDIRLMEPAIPEERYLRMYVSELTNLVPELVTRIQQLVGEVEGLKSDRSYYAQQADEWEHNEIEQHQRVEQLEQAYEYVLAAYFESELAFIAESSSTIAEDEARLTSECDDLARRHLGKGIAEVRS